MSMENVPPDWDRCVGEGRWGVGVMVGEKLGCVYNAYAEDCAYHLIRIIRVARVERIVRV